jgi:hypothetical protein
MAERAMERVYVEDFHQHACENICGDGSVEVAQSRRVMRRRGCLTLDRVELRAASDAPAASLLLDHEVTTTGRRSVVGPRVLLLHHR